MSDLEEELKFEQYLYNNTKKICKLLKDNLLKDKFPDHYERLSESLKEFEEHINKLQEKIKGAS